MRIILLSLTSIIILLVPQIALSSSAAILEFEDDESTSTIDVSLAKDTLAIGEKQYVTIDLLDFENSIVSHDDKVHLTARIVDPNDDEIEYEVPVDKQGHAEFGFTLDSAKPTGHYSIYITVDNTMEYEDYGEGFEVVAFDES